MKAKKAPKKPTRPLATFEMNGLIVRITLDAPDAVRRQTAVESCRRLGHRFAAWSVAHRADPEKAANPEFMAKYISESDSEIHQAVRLGVAVVEISK